jgi:hypothetical protein
MKEVYRYDENGIYIEPVILKDGENIPDNCTEIKPMGSFYRGKFDNGQWVESMTQAEIQAEMDDLINAPQPTSELDQLKKSQELMQQAIDDMILGGAL